ncbi:hypothetical protein AKO1_005416 [Acrasis kona]|uniref:Alpha/beta hydrolase fold-3 domain-containing protein n=1 Tax=Acrasis kona TaxID=1008807 RepID=A0AAW2YLN4_9EUKA
MIYSVGCLCFQIVLYTVAIVEYYFPSKPHKNDSVLSRSTPYARSFYFLLKICRTLMGNMLEMLIDFIPDSRMTQGPYDKSYTYHNIQVNNSGLDSVLVKSNTYNLEDNVFVIHFFGGGFLFGSPQMSLASISAMLKPLKANCLSVSYGCAQNFTLQQMVDHAEQALEWVKSKGVKSNKIVLFGESAGCVLATMLALRGHQVACMVFSSPMTDLTRTGQSYENEYNADADFLITVNGLKLAHDNLKRRNIIQDMKDHSLVQLSKKQLEKLKAPIYVFWSPLEIFYTDIVKFVSNLRQANVVVYEEGDKPSTWHCYTMYHRVIPEAKATFSNIIKFVYNNTRHK